MDTAYLSLDAAGRDRWIRNRRPDRLPVDPRRPYAFVEEAELGPDGTLWSTAVVFLTNGECAFGCLMCDLWRQTLRRQAGPTPCSPQIAAVVPQPQRYRMVKLYNAGSFFDPAVINPSEYDAILAAVGGVRRVVVECHPAFLNRHFRDFAARCRHTGVELEVAMGLETADPVALARLNKRMSVEDFESGVAAVRREGAFARAFVLVRAPWQSEADGRRWALESIRLAQAAGCDAVTMIPTRAGNGAMDRLLETGEWAPPALSTVESLLAESLHVNSGRVFVDDWDLERLATCRDCGPDRVGAIRMMNRTQRPVAPLACGSGCRP